MVIRLLLVAGLLLAVCSFDGANAQVWRRQLVDFDFAVTALPDDTNQVANVSTVAFTLEPRFLNPIVFEIEEGFSDLSLCVQPNFVPYPNSLGLTCPQNGYAYFVGSHNQTQYAPSPSLSGSSKRMSILAVNEPQSGGISVYQNPNLTASLWLVQGAPQYNAILTSTTNYTRVRVHVYYQYCQPNATSAACNQQIEEIDSKPLVNVTVPMNEWIYYQFLAPQNLGQMTFTVEGNLSSISVYAQLGAPPTVGLNVQAYVAENDTSKDQDDGKQSIGLTILSPYDQYGRTWFFGISNTGLNDTWVNVTLTNTTCAAGMFGYTCSKNLSTIQTVPWNSWDNYFDKASSQDATDDYGLVYFTYDSADVANFGPEDYLRLSLGPRSGVTSLVAYARQVGIPSQSVYDYNGTLAHVSQFLLSNFSRGQWYIAVDAKEDFVVWSGYNCFDGCEKHGYCACNGKPCDNTTLVEFPTNLNDSFGMCFCNYEVYSKSYDCLTNPDEYSFTFIVLMLLGGLIVFVAAICIPVVGVLKSRRRAVADYDTI